MAGGSVGNRLRKCVIPLLVASWFGAGGLFALFLAGGRTGLFHNTIFYSVFPVHVACATIGFPLAGGLMLCLRIGCARETLLKLSVKCSWLAIICLSLSPFAGGRPVLVDYYPFLDNWLFWGGSLLLLLSFIFLIFSLRGEDLPVRVIRWLGVWLLVVMLGDLLTAPDGPAFYKEVMWGWGHVFQFILVIFGVMGWELNRDFSLFRIALVWWSAGALLVVLKWFLPLEYAGAIVYGIGLGIPFIFLCLAGMWNGPDIWVRISAFLFLAGMLTGYTGLERNVSVPAHYHAVLAGFTISMMRVVFIEAGRRAGAFIPLMYSVGMIAVVICLMIAGVHGEPRKALSPLDDFSFWEHNKWLVFIYALGGLFAGIAGLAFIIKTGKSALGYAIRGFLPVLLILFLPSCRKIHLSGNYAKSFVDSVKVVLPRGNVVTIRDIRGDKPILVVPLYTRCPHTCPLLVEGVQELWNRRPEWFSFIRVLFLSFDTMDSREPLLYFARMHGFEKRNWMIARIATPSTLKKAFQYSIAPAGGNVYSHDNSFFLVGTRGNIVREFRGVEIPPAEFEEAIQMASTGITLPPVVTGILLSCLKFDPLTGEYVFDSSLIVNVIAGILAIAGSALWLFRMLKH